MKNKLYVLISKDLQPVYGCVQGGHAVGQFLLEHPDKWKNEYLIYVYANIEKWLSRLKMMNETYSVFYEPDLNYKPTAIAINHNGSLFKNLRLVS